LNVIIFLGFLLSMVGIIAILTVFLIWIAHTAAQAQKYRKLLEMGQNTHITGAANKSWSVSFKMNGKAREMVVEGDTEPEAIRAFIVKGGDPRHVVSVTKVM
jgi:hypothetical protein